VTHKTEGEGTGLKREDWKTAQQFGRDWRRWGNNCKLLRMSVKWRARKNQFHLHL